MEELPIVVVIFVFIMLWTTNVKADEVNLNYNETGGYYYQQFDIPLSEELQRNIQDICHEKNVPYEIVISLINFESNYKEDVISYTNDYGLMQINKGNHKWLQDDLGELDFLNGIDNCRAGIHILSNLYSKYEDNHLVLMAYNFGETRANQLWKQGIYSSNYSTKIVNYATEITENLE